MVPMDIEMKKFEKVKFGGYKTEDVDEFLDQIVLAFEEEQRNNVELEIKLTSLKADLEYYNNMEKTLQNALITAEKTAEATKEAAAKQAEIMIEEASLQAQELEQRIKDLQEQYHLAKQEIKGMLQDQLDLLESQDQIQAEVAVGQEEAQEVEKVEALKEVEEVEEVEEVDEDGYSQAYQITNDEETSQ